ncbi:MAG: class I SAM-dependent methyltransferase [Deltaproteobacteria bacterium]|nr:class I SAM-dependent methyltransferase [Deltaproteobacteria bacterium]
MCWNWKQYFKTRHEGLGTTYERFILNGYFSRIRVQYGVKSVLEAPIFGMRGISGINSIWWASHGIHVTMMDHSRERSALIREVWRELSLKADLVHDPGTYQSLPFGDREFDMSWSFAALNSDLNLKGLIGELARVTRKVIFICVPNPFNLFSRLGTVRQKNRDRFQPGMPGSGIIEKAMIASKWQVRETGYLDAPPWPDIAMPKEDLLRKMGLTRYARRLKNRITEEKRVCILDYYNGKKKEMKGKILRYAFLENTPGLLKSIVAHHRYIVFTPQHSDLSFRPPTLRMVGSAKGLFR